MEKKILIASTGLDKDLSDDKDQLDSFISRLSQTLTKENVKLEASIYSLKNQYINYDRIMNDSLFNVLLFKNELDGDMKKIFDSLVEKRNNGKPLYVFFKSTVSPKYAITLLKNKLEDNNIGYSMYIDIEQVKLDLLYHIRDLALPKLKIEYHSSKFFLGKIEVQLLPFNIKFISSYKDLKEKKDEEKLLSKKVMIIAAKELQVYNGYNDRTPEFREAQKNRDVVIKEIEKIEIELTKIIPYVISLKDKFNINNKNITVSFDLGKVDDFTDAINVNEITSTETKKKKKTDFDDDIFY